MPAISYTKTNINLSLDQGLARFFLFMVLIIVSINLIGQTEDELLEAYLQQNPDAAAALELYDRIQAADNFDETQGYEILGEVYNEYSSLQEASRLYDEAMASDDPAAIARAAQQLAKLQIEQEEFSAARSSIDLAQVSIQLSLGGRHPLSAQLWRLRAEAFSADTSPDSSINNLQQALISNSSRFADQDYATAPEEDDYLDATLQLGILLEKVDRLHTRGFRPDKRALAAALRSYEQIMALLQHLRRRYPDEARQLAIAAGGRDLSERAIGLAIELYLGNGHPSLLERAFLLSETIRSGILLDELVPQKGSLGQLTQETTLRTEIAYFKHLASRGYQAMSDSLQIKEEVLEKFLQQQANLQWPPKERKLRLNPIYDLLAQLEASYLSYWQNGSTNYVFQLDGNGIALDSFAHSRKLEQLFQQFSKNISEPSLQTDPEAAYKYFTQAAYLIYQRLFPSQFRRSDSRRLIVSPDKSIWRIPFVALLAREATQGLVDFSPNHLDYLLNRYESIAYTPALSVWRQLAETEKDLQKKSSLLTAFAPGFSGNQLAYRGCDDLPLAPLPYSLEEAKQIAALFEGELFLGEDARKADFMLASRQSSILHLATHACWSEDKPEDNQLYFSDGSLQMDDLAELSVQTRLTVLSACGSGAGKIHPTEGPLSLGRSLIRAGCPSLVLSLWDIPDASTSELMPGFYEALQTGKDVGQALNAAQRSYLSRADRSRQHPHYWAAFAVQGQDHIEFSPSGGLPSWLWLGGLFVGILIIARGSGKRKKSHSKRRNK